MPAKHADNEEERFAQMRHTMERVTAQSISLIVTSQELIARSRERRSNNRQLGVGGLTTPELVSFPQVHVEVPTRRQRTTTSLTELGSRVQWSDIHELS